MAKKIYVSLNRKAVSELMRSEEMQAACREQAERIRSRAGEGYAVNTSPGKTRCNAMVYPASKDQYYRELHTQMLIKALKG